MVDVYRAARQLERYLGYGLFGRDKPVVRDLPRPNERDILVAIITHREVGGKIVTEVNHITGEDTENI